MSAQFVHQPLSCLPFHADRAQVDPDAARHAANYALVLPVVDFLPRPGYPYRGPWVAARAGEAAPYLPEDLSSRSETSLSAGLSIGLDPRRRAATPAQLAGLPEAVARYLPRFRQPQLCDACLLGRDRMIDKAVAAVACAQLVSR